MSDFKEILSQAKKQITEVSVQEVRDKFNVDNGFTLLDVREGDEWEQGHLDQAVFVPRGFLEVKADKVLPDKQQAIVVYCAGGVRSALAAKTLQDLGYSRVYSMRGGFNEWKNNGLPFVVPEKVGKDQWARYSRHLRIPEVGEKGQLKLLKSKVLLVGAGGLGSPAGVYLAASGVGTIGLVDDDVVDESNLQRQILHWTSSVGMPKVDSARRTLFEVNPDVKVRTYQVRLDASNVLDILQDYDVIVSGSDNFTTAYMVNDAAVLLKKSVVYGSIFRFDGQASTFIPYEGPCFRCLFATPTPPELAPSCDEAGVLGVLPGVVGLIQATEAIKLLLNIGTTLSGRLLVYDALEMTFRQFKLHRDPNCATCGPNAHIDLESVPQFVCAVQAAAK
ncbi:MAG: molybdopterin-synthase adenylyltransferase MoeB [Acidobacteria bacterium]|nr:MAG: molybdopterin-synthase adenylyltransferase MoeB [Acidobacteriota bacterium]